MTIRTLLAALLAATTTLSLAACSTDSPVPEATIVAGKLCALADQAGWDDQGLNRETFVALQKAKVAIGIALDVDELTANSTHRDAQKRLTAFATGGCSLVIGSGDWLTQDVRTVAALHPKVQFVTNDHRFVPSMSDLAPSSPLLLSNVHAISNVIGEAAFEAGYLAAMSSQSHVVAALIAIGSPSTPVQSILKTAFEHGVAYYSTHGGVATKFIGVYPIPKIAPASEAIRQTVSALYNRGVDRLFVVAAKDFTTVAKVTDSFTNLQLIGTDVDWATRPTMSDAAPRILASVVRTKAADSLYGFIAFWLAGATASPAPNSVDVNSLANGGVALTEAHSIAYPNDFSNQINQLVEKLTSDGGMTQ